MIIRQEQMIAQFLDAGCDATDAIRLLERMEELARTSQESIARTAAPARKGKRRIWINAESDKTFDGHRLAP